MHGATTDHAKNIKNATVDVTELQHLVYMCWTHTPAECREGSASRSCIAAPREDEVGRAFQEVYKGNHVEFHLCEKQILLNVPQHELSSNVTRDGIPHFTCYI